MVAVVWSASAEAALDEYIGYLHERDPRIAKIAGQDIRGRVGKLAKRPATGHPSRWPGLRELSLSRWRKIAVYAVVDGGPRIVAFYDARQDLTKVKPGR